MFPQEFHESLDSLLLWLVHTEGRCLAVDIKQPQLSVGALRRHDDTLTVSSRHANVTLPVNQSSAGLSVGLVLQELQEQLRSRQTQHASLRALWSLLQPRDPAEDQGDAREDRGDAREKLHVTSNKLKQLRKRVEQDHHTLRQRLVNVQNLDPQSRFYKNLDPQSRFYSKNIKICFVFVQQGEAADVSVSGPSQGYRNFLYVSEQEVFTVNNSK